VSVVTTNESKNKAAQLESLSKILADVSNTFNPQTGTFAMLENPALASIFAKIVEKTGADISPVTLNKLQGSQGTKNIANNQPQGQPEGIVEETATATEQG